MPYELFILIKVTAIYVGLLSTAALMTLAERKVSAWIQWRIGPNRVGPFGLLQPLADGVKFIFKEEVVPEGANRVLFRMAPLLAAVPAMLTVAVVPFAGELSLFGHTTTLAIADLDISAIYVVAIGGLGVYGVILGGWSSNSKYSLLGGLRASAQMISYELTLLLCILCIVVMSGTLDLRGIIDHQIQEGLPFIGIGPGWNMFRQPLLFILFVIATFAETNRHPFDFAECEPELVGGFHTEYSSMKFALFFLGEYCAMIVMACLTTIFFLGGYDTVWDFSGVELPWIGNVNWLFQLGAFATKTAFFLFLFIWVRWTLPRFRFDQLMSLGWKLFLPIALLHLFITGGLVSFGLIGG